MKRLLILIVAVFLILSFSATSSLALPFGAFKTDRFGYTGTVKRFDTLADAQSGTNQVGDDIAIGNRDLYLSIFSSYFRNENIIMGSWWYSTQGARGLGNPQGNSGRGFIQLYDEDGSTDTDVDMAFSGFDGSHWTEFNLSLSGENADYPDDFARFWIDSQGGDADKVFYHTYNLNVTAGGLDGKETYPFWIEAFNHPTSVSGTYSGIFENVSSSFPQNNGYYTFDLALNMENWAWANRDDLDPIDFNDSYFAAAPVGEPIPEPATIVLFGLGMGGLVVFHRFNRKS